MSREDGAGIDQRRTVSVETPPGPPAVSQPVKSTQTSHRQQVGEGAPSLSLDTKLDNTRHDGTERDLGFDRLLHPRLYRLRRGSRQHLEVPLPRLQVRRRSLSHSLPGHAAPLRYPSPLHGAGSGSVHQERTHRSAGQDLSDTKR